MSKNSCSSFSLSHLFGQAVSQEQLQISEVSWRLTTPFSTNMAISETKIQGWRAIPTQWRKAKIDIDRRYRKMGWFGIVRSHSRAPFDRAHTISYKTSIVTVSILHCFWDIARCYHQFNLPQPYLVPQLGWPHSNFVEIFDIRKLDSLWYHTALFALSSF